MITPTELRDFEEEIVSLYKEGKIHHAIHLRMSEDGSYENNLIYALRNIQPQDYLFGYWDSHALALIKGVPKEELKQSILDGHSIGLIFQNHRLFASGIVGSLMGTAVGVAWAIKQKELDEKVYIYCGDMNSETGSFYEAIKYADNFKLPIRFIIGDNDLSVLTPTRAVWGNPEPWFFNTKYMEMIYYFKYKNSLPHSGLSQKVSF